MKVLILIFTLIGSFSVCSQTNQNRAPAEINQPIQDAETQVEEEVAPYEQDAFQDQYLEEIAPEEEREEYADDQTKDSRVASDGVRVECVCPQNEIQQEVAAPEPQSSQSIFPPGTVVNINPTPETPSVPPENEEDEAKKLPPGYIQKMPPGYSNDTYVPITTY